MPAFVFTADSSNEKLAITAHGQLTGDGPAVVRNIDGALPSPLAGVTEYWIIRDDADHVKLATSQANALIGTAINLTTNGTGTNILEIGIPYVRARTYVAKSANVAGSQVKSADVNALMDAHKDLHRLLTGQAQTTWARGDKVLCLSSELETGAHQALMADGIQRNRGIPLHVGDKIKSVTISRKGDGVSDLQIDLKRRLADGSVSSLDAATVTNPGATFADTVLSATSLPYTVLAGDALFLAMTPTGGNIQLGTIRVLYTPGFAGNPL